MNINASSKLENENTCMNKYENMNQDCSDPMEFTLAHIFGRHSLVYLNVLVSTLICKLEDIDRSLVTYIKVAHQMSTNIGFIPKSSNINKITLNIHYNNVVVDSDDCFGQKMSVLTGAQGWFWTGLCAIVWFSATVNILDQNHTVTDIHSAESCPRILQFLPTSHYK